MKINSRSRFYVRSIPLNGHSDPPFVKETT